MDMPACMSAYLVRQRRKVVVRVSSTFAVVLRANAACLLWTTRPAPAYPEMRERLSRGHESARGINRARTSGGQPFHFGSFFFTATFFSVTYAGIPSFP